LPETVLVTGSTGFLGSGLCRALAQRGHAVRALTRKTSSLAALEGVTVDRAIGDILDPATLPAAMDGVERVFHAAAEAAHWKNPAHLLDTAVQGTRNVVEAAHAAGVRRVVLTSSVAALGVPAPGTLLTEQSEFNLPREEFLYGYAKRQAELRALEVAQRGLDVVIVNPAGIMGPGDANRTTGTYLLLQESIRRRAIVWTDGGAPFVHIDDVVEGHLAAMERGRPGERYILNGENLEHRQVFTIIAEITGGPRPWLKIPTALIGPAAWLLDGPARPLRLPIRGHTLRLGVHYIFADNSKALRELGLPTPRPFRLAAQAAYDWYREKGLL
jgi:dihydroflavonol-4-reductase